MKLAIGTATIDIGVADPALAQAIAGAIERAVAAVELPRVECPIVQLRSRKRLALLAGQLAGAIAMVGVTPRNGRHLIAILDQLRAAGVAGIQLVWDRPTAPAAERHVFAALERARSQPAAAPVVLAATIEPAPSLLTLIAHRKQREVT